MVSLKTPATGELHAWAHRVSAATRDEDYWWGSPIETALAGLALSRHAPVYRKDAALALDRLVRWFRQNRPIVTSDDVAALALSARLETELTGTSPEFLGQAVQAVDKLARRDWPALPELHLAFCTWALDDLVADRGELPWPALREFFQRRSAHTGVVRALSAALVLQVPDNDRLVDDLASATPALHDVSDLAIFVWTATAAIARLAPDRQSSDNRFRLLLEKRAEMVERLTQDVATSMVVDHEWLPSESIADSARSFEALLLDMCLAPDGREPPWLTLDEAEALFAERIDSSAVALSRAGAGASVALAAAVYLALDRVAAPVATSTSAALAILGFGFGAASRFPRRRRRGGFFPRAGRFFILLGVLFIMNALNHALPSPVIADSASFVLGPLLAAVATLIWDTLDSRGT